jgi:hypothetical protein
VAVLWVLEQALLGLNYSNVLTLILVVAGAVLEL